MLKQHKNQSAKSKIQKEISQFKSPKLRISAVLASKKYPSKAKEIIDILSLKSEISDKLKKHDSSLVGVDYGKVYGILDQLLDILSEFGPLSDNLLYDFLITHKRFIKKRAQRLELCFLESEFMSELVLEKVVDLESQLEGIGVDLKKLLRFESSKEKLNDNLQDKVSELLDSFSDISEIDKLNEYIGV